MADAVTRFWARIADCAGVRLDGIRFLYAAFDHQRQSAPNRGLDENGDLGHCNASELCEAFIALAQKSFGDEYCAALRSWNLDTSEKLGALVYVLVDHRLIGKQGGDHRSDFDGHFDFSEVTPALANAEQFRYAYGLPAIEIERRRRWPLRVLKIVLIIAGCYALLVASYAMTDLVEPVPPLLVIVAGFILAGFIRSLLPRPLRFSLSSLFIALTLGCLGLGLVMWLVR